MQVRAKCANCGKAFAPGVFWQRYCSKKCRTYVTVNAWRERTGRPTLGGRKGLSKVEPLNRRVLPICEVQGLQERGAAGTHSV
jgi:hypothetical protein